MLIDWGDPSSRFIADNICQISSILKRFEGLCNKKCDYCLFSTMNTIKRRVSSNIQTCMVKGFLCSKTLKMSMLFLELLQAQSCLDHHLDVLQAPQFRDTAWGIKCCESDSVNPNPSRSLAVDWVSSVDASINGWGPNTNLRCMVRVSSCLD